MISLHSLLRPRRASTGRRRARALRPVVDSLEGRQLLDGAIGLARVVSLNGPSAIGEKFELQAVQSNGLPYAPGTISSITWTIDGAVKNRTLDTTGFHDTPLDTTTYGDTISGYWTTAGKHTIVETINYVQPTWQGIPIPTRWPDRFISTLDVYSPKVTAGTPDTFKASIPTVVAEAKYLQDETRSGWIMGAGAEYTAKVGNTITDSRGVTYPVNGVFGMIQTLTSDNLDAVANNEQMRSSWNSPSVRQWYADPTTGKPYTMLDNSPDSVAVGGQDSPLPADSPLRGVNNPYYGTFQVFGGLQDPAGGSIFTTSVGNTLGFSDSPKSFASWNTVSEYRSDTFTDSIVFTPAGGIPVALGSFKWNWEGTAQYEWGAKTATNPYLDPNTRQGMISGAQGPRLLGGFQQSNTLPTWDMTVQTANSKPGVVLNRDNPGVDFPVLPPTYDPWSPDWTSSGDADWGPNPPEWTGDGGVDWSEWTTTGGASWTDPVAIMPSTPILQPIVTSSYYQNSVTGEWESGTATTPPPGYPAYDAWGHAYGTPLYCVAIAVPTYYYYGDPGTDAEWPA